MSLSGVAWLAFQLRARTPNFITTVTNGIQSKSTQTSVEAREQSLENAASQEGLFESASAT